MQERVNARKSMILKADPQNLIALLSEEPHIHGSVRFGHLEACGHEKPWLMSRLKTRTVPMPAMESQKKA